MADEEVTDTNPTSCAEDERGDASVASGGVAHVDAITTVASQLAAGKISYELFLSKIQEESLKCLDPTHPGYKGAKEMVKNGNEKRRRAQSTGDCQKVLEELHQPIKEKLKNRCYGGEGGSLVYQQDMEDLKRAYLATDMTEDMGCMKGAELDKFLCRHSGELAAVEEVDTYATQEEETNQAKLLSQLTILLKLFENYREAYKAWFDTRSDSINWFNVTADTLDGKKKIGNKAAIGTASIGLVAGATGIVVVSVALAPVTFGASLALGLGLGSAAVGMAAGGTGLGFKIAERKYNTRSDKEQIERLKKDHDQFNAIKAAGDELGEHAMKLEETLRAEFGIGRLTGGDVFGTEEGGNQSKVDAVVRASVTVAKGASTVAQPVKIMLDMADDTINIAKMGGQVADDVLNGAKAGLVAAKVMGGLAIGFGAIGIAVDTYTLVSAIKDLRKGSKSELAAKFRDKAEGLKNDADLIESKHKGKEEKVDEAEEFIRPLLKRGGKNLIRVEAVKSGVSSSGLEICAGEPQIL